MNTPRVFKKKLLELVKAGGDPLLVLPVLELLEECLINLQSDYMADKDLLPDEKGRMSMVITPLIQSTREAKDMCGAAKREIPTTPTKLRNPHLQ